MKNKYNLALTPCKKADDIILLANQFKSIADGYLLGNNSLPHVTLYHFFAGERDISTIWKRTISLWHDKYFTLTFEKFSCITFKNDVFWISLLPNKIEFLHHMHHDIADILQLPVKKNFDPHMTLLNTKNRECEHEAHLISQHYNVIEDTFILSLGKSDDIGQFTELIYSK